MWNVPHGRELVAAVVELEQHDAVLAALESVNAVFIFDDLRATSFLQIAQPDIYVKGGDYTVDQLPAEERAIIETQGGRITVLGHLPGKSSTEIARRILEG